MIKQIFSLVLLFSGTTLFGLKGLSLNGSTGVITTPSGNVGWEISSDLALDVGYHHIFTDNPTHIPSVTLSFLKRFEVGLSMDSQQTSSASDILFHGKYQVFREGDASIAVGGNIQFLNFSSENSRQVSQIYLASTYRGDFFQMPANTTIVFGKRFAEGMASDDIDFSMAFDLTLFPDVFHGYIHWINDFSNYSYSHEAIGANAYYRGSYNTGLRINVLPESRFKFVVDFLLMDALDSTRTYSIGGAFGFSL